jgi:hypothetical protein
MSMEHSGYDEKDGGLRVHISGTDVTSTKEVEPEHWVFRTVVIPPFTETQEGGGTGAQEAGNGYQMVLNEDPLRKDVVIYFPDGPGVLCHSAAQASNVANYAAGIPFPEGGYFPQGSNTPNLSGTGPMWVANPGPATIPTPAQPAVPATGVAQQNPNAYPVNVVINANGATITNVSVNGITVGTGAGSYVVPAYGSISIAYSVATPTWVWSDANAATPTTIRVVILTNRRGI